MWMFLASAGRKPGEKHVEMGVLHESSKLISTKFAISFGGRGRSSAAVTRHIRRLLIKSMLIYVWRCLPPNFTPRLIRVKVFQDSSKRKDTTSRRRK